MDLRFETPLAEMRICDVRAQYATQRIDRIEPGFPDDSLIIQRISERGLDQMPPIATSIVHPDGVAPLREWVTGVQCPPE